jgi:O-antigen/teichoic acid export membrane protein
MEKALKMGQTSAVGSFWLFLGRMLSTVMLAVGTIILGWFISEPDYGLYTIALIPATTFLLFQDWGISSAMTKYCAGYRASGRADELRTLIVAGLTFEVASGLALTVVSVVTASFIASTIFGNPASALLISFASITILFNSLFVGAQSVFVGFERMRLISLTLICQSVTQGVLSPLLVYLGYGAWGALVGYTLASLIMGLTSVVLLYFAIFRKLPKSETSSHSLYRTLKPLLNYGVPLAIAYISAGLLTQIFSFIMGSVVDLSMIGNYRIATNFAILLTFFTIPITTNLFPTFSKLDPRNEQGLLKTVFTSSAKYTAFLLVPATMALMVLSQQLISALYGAKWLYAPLFLSLYVIHFLLSLFGYLIVNSLLTATGETKILMRLNLVNLSVGVPLALLLIPNFGIIGLIVAMLISGLPSAFIGLYWTSKHFGASVDFKASAKILLASTSAALTTWVFLITFTAAAWITLTAGLIIFLLTYLAAAPLVGAINQADINNFRSMFSGLGLISKLIEIPLTLMEKPLKIQIKWAEKRHQ